MSIRPRRTQGARMFRAAIATGSGVRSSGMIRKFLKVHTYYEWMVWREFVTQFEPVVAHLSVLVYFAYYYVCEIL